MSFSGCEVIYGVNFLLIASLLLTLTLEVSMTSSTGFQNSLSVCTLEDHQITIYLCF